MSAWLLESLAQLKVQPARIGDLAIGRRVPSRPNLGLNTVASHALILNGLDTDCIGLCPMPDTIV